MFVYNTKRLIASREDRTISGLLIPYGEKGQTNKGTVTASRGVLTMPTGDELVPLNIEHRRADRIGRAISLEETDEGIRASFKILETRAGDDALLEAAEGIRASLSIEIDEPVIRAGQIKAGRITGAALVAEPAFPSAVLTASVPDEGTLADAAAELADTASTISGIAAAITPTPDETNTETSSTETENTMPITAAKAQLGNPALHATDTHDMKWLLANLTGQLTDSRLYAALADVVPANILGLEQPQYIGQMWNGKAYTRKIIPQFAHAALSSFKVQGWKWETRPTVGTYTGNKAKIPSAEISTKPVEIDAKRIAGGHDIDRKFRDFPNEEFWLAYFAAMTESYAKLSDQLVLAEVKEAAPKVSAGTKPAEIAQGLVNIVDGAISIMNETETMPTVAFVAPNLWREIVLTPADNVLGYLNAAMGLEDGSLGSFPIIPSASLSSGETLVAVKDAVTVHELGGAAPIRVEALDVSRGGIDEGVFGYYAVNVHDAQGLALVTAAA